MPISSSHSQIMYFQSFFDPRRKRRKESVSNESQYNYFVAYNQQPIKINQFPFFINYCLTKKHYMEKQNPYDEDLTISIKPRDYKCPCGKTYLSYAALFTHIKQKHEGKAPGKITKPPSLHEKRGRPPVKPKSDKKDLEKPTEASNQNIDGEPLFPPETEEEKQSRQSLADIAILQIVEIIEQMPDQQLNKAHLNQIDVFSEMNVYLNTRSGPPIIAHGNICVADGLFQFTQHVCTKITWKKFESFYLLFMLFLQFITDSENDKKVLSENNMDLFCEYINDFIENNLKEMAECYELEGLWIIQKENSIRLFYRFFNWCMCKRYVTYRINLAPPKSAKNEFYEEHRTQGNIKIQ